MASDNYRRIYHMAYINAVYSFLLGRVFEKWIFFSIIVG